MSKQATCGLRWMVRSGWLAIHFGSVRRSLAVENLNIERLAVEVHT